MEDMATVSFAAYESSMVRMHRLVQKLVVSLVVSIILLFTSNMVWLYVWVQDSNPVIANNVARVSTMMEVKASNEAIDQERKRHASKEKKAKIDWTTLSRSEIEYLIDEWIFSERDRKIIKRRLLDAITLERLAEEFDLSVSQIKNIVRKCQWKLFF